MYGGLELFLFHQQFYNQQVKKLQFYICACIQGFETFVGPQALEALISDYGLFQIYQS